MSTACLLIATLASLVGWGWPEARIASGVTTLLVVCVYAVCADHAYERIAAALKHDCNTGLLTGYAVDRLLQNETRVAIEGEQPMAIAILIIKLTNLREVRQQHRRCEQEVAARLKSIVASTDIVAHYGEGRFVVLVRNRPVDYLTKLAIKLREGVNAVGVSQTDRRRYGLALSATVGCVNRGSGESQGQLMRRLYAELGVYLPEPEVAPAIG